MVVGLIKTRRFEDARGWFMETYTRSRFADLGIDDVFVQDNHSLSTLAGTLRGLHFQRPPHAQAKLVRCVRGAIVDVAVDLRRNSPTYGKWVDVELTAANGDQLYIPAGFAHGFMTLEPETEVVYKVSDIYAPHCDGGIIWNDPYLAIDWPTFDGVSPIISTKDSRLPTLAEFDSPFDYDGQPLHLKTVYL